MYKLVERPDGKCILVVEHNGHIHSKVFQSKPTKEEFIFWFNDLLDACNDREDSY